MSVNIRRNMTGLSDSEINYVIRNTRDPELIVRIEMFRRLRNKRNEMKRKKVRSYVKNRFFGGQIDIRSSGYSAVPPGGDIRSADLLRAIKAKAVRTGLAHRAVRRKVSSIARTLPSEVIEKEGLKPDIALITEESPFVSPIAPLHKRILVRKIKAGKIADPVKMRPILTAVKPSLAQSAAEKKIAQMKTKTSQTIVPQEVKEEPVEPVKKVEAKKMDLGKILPFAALAAIPLFLMGN